MIYSLLDEYLFATPLGLLLGTLRAAVTSPQVVTTNATAPVAVAGGLDEPWT